MLAQILPGKTLPMIMVNYPRPCFCFHFLSLKELKCSLACYKQLSRLLGSKFSCQCLFPCFNRFTLFFFYPCLCLSPTKLLSHDKFLLRWLPFSSFPYLMKPLVKRCRNGVYSSKWRPAARAKGGGHSQTRGLAGVLEISESTVFVYWLVLQVILFNTNKTVQVFFFFFLFSSPVHF